MGLRLLFSFFLIIAALIGCEKAIDQEQLQYRQGIAYVVNSTEPLTGDVVGWHANGQKAYEGSFVAGLKEAIHTEWYENGQKKSDGNFEAGVAAGVHSEWYENGLKKSQGNYIADLADGIHTEWWPTGQRKLEGNFAAGKKDGIHTEWLFDGTTKKETTFVANVKEGPFSVWTDDGKLFLKGKHHAGEMSEWIMYDEDGSEAGRYPD